MTGCARTSDVAVMTSLPTISVFTSSPCKVQRLDMVRYTTSTPKLNPVPNSNQHFLVGAYIIYTVVQASQKSLSSRPQYVMSYVQICQLEDFAQLVCVGVIPKTL